MKRLIGSCSFRGASWTNLIAPFARKLVPYDNNNPVGKQDDVKTFEKSQIGIVYNCELSQNSEPRSIHGWTPLKLTPDPM